MRSRGICPRTRLGLILSVITGPAALLRDAREIIRDAGFFGEAALVAIAVTYHLRSIANRIATNEGGKLENLRGDFAGAC